MARCIVVNSNFTKKVFEDNFPIIRRCCKSHKPKVLYPSIQEKSFKKSGKNMQTISEMLGREITRDTMVLTSLNRYERKKNIGLALESFAYMAERNTTQECVLVVAGGYDVRLPENVQHHLELVAKAEELNIKEKIVFLRSISNDQRLVLLENTKVLLYTPENEHFGIVPVEAMHLGCIVIACNSGGPLESVADGKTGYLLSPDAEEWG
jgi:alpha-1,3/alpha-1,6-mannosyltransferase